MDDQLTLQSLPYLYTELSSKLGLIGPLLMKLVLLGLIFKMHMQSFSYFSNVYVLELNFCQNVKIR